MIWAGKMIALHLVVSFLKGQEVNMLSLIQMVQAWQCYLQMLAGMHVWDVGAVLFLFLCYNLMPLEKSKG